MKQINCQFTVATADDALPILEIYAPFCASDSAVSFEIVPPPVEEMERRILSTLDQLPWLIACQGDRVLGYAYASRHRERAAYRWSADATVYLAPHARGQGIGTSLYTLLFDLLRLQGYFNVYAGITLPNAGSIALHESMGFKRVGHHHKVGYKGGAWHDVVHYELPLQEHVVDPPEPISFRQLVASGKTPQSLVLR